MGKSFYKIIVLAMGLLFCSTSLFAEAKQGIRVALGSGSGKIEVSGNSSLNHNLSGTALGVSYIRILENNVLFGGGYQTMETSGSKNTVFRNIKIKVETKYQADFLYGLVGYEIKINDKISFQPNLRLGSKTLKLKVKMKALLAEVSASDSTSDMDFEIALPVVYKFNETIGAGANLCWCNNVAKSPGEGSLGRETYTSSNMFNLLLDIYF